MDISFYISELLELRGDVNVPGLGYLLQGRISGYYNEAEGKFYPPHNEVQFEPGLLDDDTTLTQYIADKKNISLASALYFTEKYVNALKEEALQHDVAIANIGWFYYNGSTLAFRAAKKITNDAAFYGYEPIKATKIGEQPVAEPTPAPEPEPIYSSVLVPERVAEEVEEDEDDDTLYDAPRTNRLLRGWIIVISILILLLVILFGLYKYNPALFDRLSNWRNSKTTSTVTIAPADTVKADTLITDSTTQLITDTSNTVKSVQKTTTTTTKTVPAAPPVSGSITTPPQSTTVVTTTPPKGGYFAIIIKEYATLGDANAAVSTYKAKGVDAHIVNTSARPIKVSAGRYSSLDDAEEAMTKLISSGKITDDAYPIEIKR